MERFYILDNKNTFADWDLIVTDSTITPPEIKTNYIDIDGMSGSLDLSEALTGEITYNDRTISMSFLTDHGKRDERAVLLHKIRAFLHGRKIKIIEPDDPTHYFYGRVKIKDETNILPYATISLEAVCDPWRYAVNETNLIMAVTSSAVTNFVIRNNGIKTLCPNLIVNGTVNIHYGGNTIKLTTGTVQISDLKLYTGTNIIGVSGSGSLNIVYREATL